MKRFLAIFAMAGLAVIGQHSGARAEGLIMSNLTRVDGVEDCNTRGDCARDGHGWVSSLKIRQVNNLDLEMQGLLPRTGYHMSYKGENCRRIRKTFITDIDGNAKFTLDYTRNVPQIGDLVEICRDVARGGNGVEPVYTGVLARPHGENNPGRNP